MVPVAGWPGGRPAPAESNKLKAIDTTEAAELWQVIRQAQRTKGGQVAEPQR